MRTSAFGDYLSSRFHSSSEDFRNNTVLQFEEKLVGRLPVFIQSLKRRRYTHLVYLFV